MEIVGQFLVTGVTGMIWIGIDRAWCRDIPYREVLMLMPIISLLMGLAVLGVQHLY